MSGLRANTLLILGNPVNLIWMSALSGYLIDLTSGRFRRPADRNAPVRRR
jgi:hypothetical protein